MILEIKTLGQPLSIIPTFEFFNGRSTDCTFFRKMNLELQM